MSLTRISTLGQHQMVLNNVSKTQSDLAILQRQISSGREAQYFSDLDVRVEVVTALETKARQTQQYMDSNGLILNRLQSTAQAVDNITELSTEIRQTIMTARSGTRAQYSALKQIMQNNLNGIAGLLNTNIGGYHLFGGTKTNTPPVTVPVPAPIVDETPDSGYYVGDTVDQTAHISESLEITYGVRGDEQGFQELFTAIHTAIDGLDNTDDDKLAKAMELITDAMNNIGGIQARVNTNMTTVTSTNEHHDATLPYIKQFISQETDTDVVAATTRSAIDETILQASFQVFARIANLNLGDYLR